MRLCKKILKTTLLVLIAVMLTSGTVLAAYSYYATIQVQETGGNSYDYLPVIADIDNDYLADNGYMSLTGLDTRVLSGSTELEHMVADDKVLFVAPSIGADSTSNYRYTLGNSLLSNFPIIVGHDGYITMNDDADLELGSDFEIEWDGYIDTDAGADKNLVEKEDAFRVYVSDNEEITAAIYNVASDLISQTTKDDHVEISANDDFVGQTFTTPASGINLVHVTVWLINGGGSTGTMTVAIRETSAGLPTGGNLVADTKDIATIAATPGAAYDFTLDYDLDENTMYAIVGYSEDIAVQVSYFDKNTAGGYADGTLVTALNGAAWSITAGEDLYFEVNGVDASALATATGMTTGEHTITTSIEDAPTDITGYSASASIAMDMGVGVVPAMVLETQTLAAPAASVTFSNIDTLVAYWDTTASVTSRHLVISINAQSADAVNQRDVELQFNGDTGANYNYEYLEGQAASAANIVSGATQIVTFPISGTAVDVDAFGGGTVLIPHAFNTTNHKALLSFGGAAEDEVEVVMGRWAGTDAVTDILLEPSAGNFATGSEFILAVVDERYLVEEEYNTGADFLPVFDAIPGDGHDLVVIGYSRTDNAAGFDRVSHEINNDANVNNYCYQYVDGNLGGTSAFSSATSRRIAWTAGDNATTNVFCPLFAQYFQYAEVVNHKTILTLGGLHEDVGPRGAIALFSSRWKNTAAITRLEYIPEAGANFKANSLFSLYRVPRYVIDRQVLAAPQAIITFANIPQGYSHLQLNVYARSDLAVLLEDYVTIEFNADAVAGNYDSVLLDGNAGVVNAAQNAADVNVIVITADGEGANEFGGGTVNIYDYTKTDRDKHYISIGGRGHDEMEIRSMRWEDTSAITQIRLQVPAQNFMAGSVFELVGWIPSKIFMMDIDGDDWIADGAEVSVPDNANDWIINQNNTMPYMDYYKHTVDGTLIAWYQPVSMIIGTNLDDREGTDIGETGTEEEDGIITWGANVADLDVTIGSLISSSQPVISPASEEEAPDIVPEGEVPITEGTVDTAILEDNPLYPIVKLAHDYTGFTEEQIWFFLATLIILIGMGLAAVKVPSHLLLAGTVGLVLSGFFTAMEIYQWWMMLIFGFMFIMSILMERKPVL